MQFHPYVRSIPEFLGVRGNDFDIVLLSRHYVAAKHIDAARVFAPNALVVFDTVDLHFLREERLAELEGSASGISAARARRDEELALIAKADVTLVVSEVERALLQQLAPASRVMVLSNIHEPVPGGKPFAEREGLVFIGGFQHPPNTDAVLWYAQEILPRVREQLPGVPTYIVGSKVPAPLKALAAKDFIITGYVPDVAPYFSGCRVSIAPLRYGAGVKGKVNLAMSWGLPVVATTPSIEGMHLTEGEDVLIADDPAAFADAIVRLYRDEALWTRLAAGGLANIRAPLFARRRAQCDHAAHRAGPGQRRAEGDVTAVTPCPRRRVRSSLPSWRGPGRWSAGRSRPTRRDRASCRAPRTWSAAGNPGAGRNRTRYWRAAARR